MRRITDDELEFLRDTWDKYLHDDTYNDIGKLNLACWLGERYGPVLDEVNALRGDRWF